MCKGMLICFFLDKRTIVNHYPFAAFNKYRRNRIQNNRKEVCAIVFSTDKQCCEVTRLPGDETTVNKIEYVDGNTVIWVNEHFPETGKTAGQLIENVIRYEGRMTKSQEG